MGIQHKNFHLMKTITELGQRPTSHPVNDDFDIDEEIALHLTEYASKGLMVDDVPLPPLSVARQFVIGDMIKAMKAKECSTATLLLKSENYIARIKVATGGTVRNQMTKDMGRVIWNFSFIFEDHLCSLIIGTKRKHNHSKRVKNA